MPELNRMEIIVPAGETELLTALLALRVNHGWEEEDLPSGETLFRVHTHNPLFFQELETELRAYLPDLDISLDQVPELDWVQSWKEFFTPVEAGSRFLVLAPWMEAERAAARRTAVIIEPKTAFGTGHHATTALCLQALSDFYDDGRIKSGQTFLDLGTGSGILGIAAAKLGLSGLGVDPDLLAVENALENRELNAVAPKDFRVARGSLEAVAEGPFDLILANILAEPLLNLAPGLLALLRPGGCLALSGILINQAAQIREAYAALGEPRVLTRDEWACLCFNS